MIREKQFAFVSDVMLRKSVLKISFVILVVIGMCSCKGKHDLTGMWHGSILGKSEGDNSTIDAAFQQGSQGLSGNMVWHIPVQGSTSDINLIVNSGVVYGDKASFVATYERPGYKMSLNFTGLISGGTIKGTYLRESTRGDPTTGTFELKKE